MTDSTSLSALIEAERAAEFNLIKEVIGALGTETLVRAIQLNPPIRALVSAVEARSTFELREQKDGAYAERNKTVVALAWMALRNGWRVGVREHEGADWDDGWRALLVIDLPTGQASWHFHDSERPMLAGFPAYPDEWDGHTTDEKYERLAALNRPTDVHLGGQA